MTSSDEIKPTIRKLSIEGFSNDKLGLEKKIGHRRVDGEGLVTYKKRPTSELMAAIQLGIGHSVGSLASKQSRDVLYEDFHVVETLSFPSNGSNITPAHRYSDFKFRTYAPVAFRYFRDLFKIQPENYLLSLCNEPLVELSNPGASGSIFYLSQNDEFIIKTVQYKEADFLKKLLPGYYMNLNQNPCTFLPKFYGLYCYQCGGKNIRFVIMNNILPSHIAFYHKFDLKGSTYNRKASRHEKAKPIPTLKDIDFRELYNEGLLLDAEMYQRLIKTMSRDCRVLESFKIMDYSFLIGIQKLTHNSNTMNPANKDNNHQGNNQMNKSHLTQTNNPVDCNPGFMGADMVDGIPATDSNGDHLKLFVGIIDILQSYRFAKKFEHAFKSVIHDGDTISVHHPKFYAQRFQEFFSRIVFQVNRQLLKPKVPPGRKSIVALNDQSHGVFNKYRPDVLPLKSPSSLNMDGNKANNIELKNREDVLARKAMASSHLSVVSKSNETALSTPTFTQHTDATFSYTASSPSDFSLNDDTVVNANDITLQLNATSLDALSPHQINISPDKSIIHNEVVRSIDNYRSTDNVRSHFQNNDASVNGMTPSSFSVSLPFINTNEEITRL